MAAHPRSRGENHLAPPCLILGVGSSPLTRGKPKPLMSLITHPGLIPAHAGKTSGPSKRVIRPWAHPRSRGENTRRPPATPTSLGSSPLTRGKPAALGHYLDAGGLIPAHAGKTAKPSSDSTSWGAHPRSRGENWPSIQSSATVSGSSPLTRGKLRDSTRERLAQRLIPAHAGKTQGRARPARHTQAHPRSRGENTS